MFLKMYTGLSCPKLMEQLNGNTHYQIFCDVIIDPTRPLTNYKLLDDIMLELAGKLKIQQLQDILADKWKSYMENLDTVYTDATCYEGEMRYPTDAKLLRKGMASSSKQRSTTYWSTRYRSSRSCHSMRSMKGLV